MNTCRRLSILTTLIAMFIISVNWAQMDAAPPQQPPADTIGNGGFDTDVQMVSEEVLLVVSEADEPVDGWDTASNYMQGHVEATFWMQNQGEETESFEVWFPLGVESGYSEISVVENFEAWVDEEAAQIGHEELPGQWDGMVPWATWPATFPPGEAVTIRVAYDLRPTGYMPYGDFTYILETGAGWWSEIGEGTITVRLPYEANPYTAPNYTKSPAIDNFKIEGTDLIWHFTNLEPTREENITVTVMAVSQGEAILAAEEAVTENPASADAYGKLARAQADGLQFKYGLVCCEPLANAAIENFQRAWALDPDNAEVQIDYLDLLVGLWFPYDETSYSEDIPSLIASALSVAPDDEHLLDLIEQTLGTLQWAVEANPESAILQQVHGELRAALTEAAEANPDNKRLQDIYFSLDPAG